MKKSNPNPAVDSYFTGAMLWRREMEILRTICLGSGLREELKWGKPCYTHRGKNIVLIQGFRRYCALLFFKGYLLEDPAGILVKTGPRTVTGRQVRFHNPGEITAVKPLLEEYIRRAVETETAVPAQK